MDAPKKWFEISKDELESRMIRHEIMYAQPLSQAGAMIGTALDKILVGLGVDVEKEITHQLELMGIGIFEMTQEEGWPEDSCGLTVMRASDVGDGKPYAWIRDPMIDKDGNIYLEVWKYQPREELWTFHCGVNVTKLGPQLVQ